jgi:hypothetical protein
LELRGKEVDRDRRPAVECQNEGFALGANPNGASKSSFPDRFMLSLYI